MQTHNGDWNLLAGWVATLTGILSGAAIGLFFHREDWLGGYGSYRRRLVRLGHVSFFGLGFTNILFGLSGRLLPGMSGAATALMIVSAATMPICCFLTAWRKPFRVLFPLPVASAAAAIALLLVNWRTQ